MSPRIPSRQPDVFHDRIDAGIRLAKQLRPILQRAVPGDVVAVGLARGGVIVAAEVARELGIRLEAIVVRKMGAPDQPELAIGALAASGERTLNTRLIADIGLREMDVDRIAARAQEAARVLGDDIGVPARVPDIRGKNVLLIDDGLATGATMRVAIDAVYHQGARYVVVALPVAPASMVRSLRALADDLVVILTPGNLNSVGQWYRIFLDVPSEDVQAAIEENRHPRTSRG
jgi:putative phosphoribosyl transferase